MYRFLFILIILTLIIYSCDDEGGEVDKFGLLNSSSWLGPIKITDTDYDLNNNLVDQQSTEIPDGQYNLMTLNSNKAASIKYNCDKEKCEGDNYEGTWELQGDLLIVLINREELNSLSDALFIEGEISQLSSSELVIEIILNNPTPEVAKRIRQIIYTSN